MPNTSVQNTSQSNDPSSISFSQVHAALDSSPAQKKGGLRRLCDSDNILFQGLSSTQIDVLAQKVYDLLLDELRIEAERHGRRVLR